MSPCARHPSQGDFGAAIARCTVLSASFVSRAAFSARARVASIPPSAESKGACRRRIATAVLANSVALSSAPRRWQPRMSQSQGSASRSPYVISRTTASSSSSVVLISLRRSGSLAVRIPRAIDPDTVGISRVARRIRARSTLSCGIAEAGRNSEQTVAAKYPIAHRDALDFRRRPPRHAAPPAADVLEPRSVGSGSRRSVPMWPHTTREASGPGRTTTARRRRLARATSTGRGAGGARLTSSAGRTPRRPRGRGSRRRSRRPSRGSSRPCARAVRGCR